MLRGLPSVLPHLFTELDHRLGGLCNRWDICTALQRCGIFFSASQFWVLECRLPSFL